MGLFDEIRQAAREVASRARSVRVDAPRLEELADALAAEASDPVPYDPAHHHLSSESATLAYVITLDAVNFGSGWFPHLRKRVGHSGYFTIAGALRDRFESGGPLDARGLARLTAGDCARIFDQDPVEPESPIAVLLEHFATSLRSLGELLLREHEGRFESLVEGARGSAEALVTRLAAMPSYRDVSRYEDFDVPLYKRAQITCADLAAAFEGRGYGRFDDLDQLTIFADNLVPHVLRCEGVLHYEAGLLARIEAGTLIEPGSPEEVEIRAVALDCVERMVDRLTRRGVETNAARLDHRLWSRGQAPAIKAHPRHRARTVFY